MTQDESLIIVMTGATSGLGLEAARVLGQRQNVHLIVGARAPEQAEALCSAVPEERLSVVPLDTASLSSVRTFAAEVHRERDGRAIFSLGLNAGTLGGDTLQLTDDGVERTFATNCLGHYVLAHELKEALVLGAAVIMTASQSHNPDDLIGKLLLYRGAIYPNAGAVARGELDTAASPAQATRDRYATSKLCCILSIFALARRTPGEEIRFLAYDPGAVPATQLARDLGLGARLGWSYILPLVVPLLPSFTTPQTSGRSLARLLVNPKLAPQTGQYLNFRLEPATMWSEAQRTDWQDDILSLCDEFTAQS